MIWAHNIEQIQQKCDSCNIKYNKITNWTSLLKLTKQDKCENKYFTTYSFLNEMKQIL